MMAFVSVFTTNRGVARICSGTAFDWPWFTHRSFETSSRPVHGKNLNSGKRSLDFIKAAIHTNSKFWRVCCWLGA